MKFKSQVHIKTPAVLTTLEGTTCDGRTLSGAYHDVDSPEQLTTSKHRWLVLRVDIAVIPLVSLLYLFCFIDRVNIGNSSLNPSFLTPVLKTQIPIVFFPCSFEKIKAQWSQG